MSQRHYLLTAKHRKFYAGIDTYIFFSSAQFNWKQQSFYRLSSNTVIQILKGLSAEPDFTGTVTSRCMTSNVRLKDIITTKCP